MEDMQRMSNIKTKDTNNLKNKTDVYQEEVNRMEMSEDEARRVGRIQFPIVIVLLLVVLGITEAITYYFGKVTGNVCLVLIVIGISVYLYKNEIMDFFKGKNRK